MNGYQMNTFAEQQPFAMQMRKEIITPHRLTIAILIRSYNIFRNSDQFKQLEDENLKARYRRDFCVLTSKLIQSPDLTLEELRNLLASKKYRVAKTVINSFDKAVTDLYNNGLGQMLDIVDSFPHIMMSSDNAITDPNKSLISRSCVVGFYLRRLIVNFGELTFCETTTVYSAFQRYYDEFQKSFELRHQITAEANKVVYSEDWSADRDQWSRRHAEFFIATQGALLTNNEEKALRPKELQERINTVLKSNPHLAEGYFLSYLNFLRIKEFCGAVDSLYICFDERTTVESDIPPEEKSKSYRFAALNLAILHYHFGHKEEALSLLKESIKISQEANDNVCLQHSLAWLYRLTSINKDKLIEHSVLKSFELSLSYITSLGIQTFVQYACLVSGHPLQIFETLMKCDMINCEHNYRDLTCNDYAVKSSLWQFYGKTEMSSLWSQLLLYLNIDNPTPSKAFYGEGFCLAVCNIANMLMLQGDYSATHCVFSFLKKMYVDEPNRHIWMLCENVFMFTRALNHENWSEAESAAQKIIVFDKWEGYLRMAELYLYKQDYTEAKNCLTALMELYENEEKYKLKSIYYIRAEILMAEILFANSYPNVLQSGIMTLLNNCLPETSRYQLDYHTAMVHLHIAHIQFTMGMTSQALKVLDRCLIQILSHGGYFDRGRALLLYAKCLIAHSHEEEPAERNKVILDCTKILTTVKHCFRKIEAYSRQKDVLYLQAQLYNHLNLPDERNQASLDYRQLEEEYPTKNIVTLVKYL